jgi:hypothetical protein
MLRLRILATLVVLVGLRAVTSTAAERIRGGDQRFAASIASQVRGKPVRFVLTGTAMRTKYGLSVYAIGSYVEEGVRIRNPDELARVNVAKQLHLIFEREVDGGTIASSFREAVAMNHPAPAFAAELNRLEAYFRPYSARRGDHVVLNWLPGVGLSCQMLGRPSVLIESPSFAQAAWEVYLGPRNLGAAIKEGLTSRL